LNTSQTQQKSISLRVSKRIKRFKRLLRTLFPTKRGVDFIICGAQKGGTTALDQYLREHPSICMAEKKEVHFFDNEDNFIDGKGHYPKYHSHFSPSRKHKLIGEASPIYMYWEKVPERIFKYNPNMKLIVLLRNPIERAYSQWNMMRLNGDEDLSFLDALKQEKDRCQQTGSLQHRLYSYTDRGFYLNQLKRLWEHFPKENILIIKSEELKEKPGSVLNDVTNFLKVEKFKQVKVKNVHSLPYNKIMNPEEVDLLKSIFEPEIHRLEKALKWDCSEWLK